MTRRVPVLLVLILLLACSSDDKVSGPPNNPPAGEADMDQYVGSLGSWAAFAPPLAASDVPQDAPAITDETVNNVTYTCSETPYSLTDTPREIVMYEPNASIMWVGNLLQGKSYKNGTGSFQELSIRQRAPLKISIDLLTGDNFAIVENPTLTSVQAAIGGLIQRATDAGHVSGSSINYTSFRMNSATEVALRMGMSASLIGQGVPVELDVKSQVGFNASVSAVMAHFVQKMFTISIELPQSAADMFSNDLTQTVLDQQVAAGNIGPDNLPVYIASITYGRTLDYSLMSGEAEVVQHAAVEASLLGVKGAPSGYLETDVKHALSASSIKATAIGGNGASIVNLIRTEKLSEYFTEDAPLTSARPISYQLNFLGDNSIAKVAETQKYSQRVCNQKPASPGVFDFKPVQLQAAGISAPYKVHRGDIDGDGREDLILNSLLSGSNQIAVGLGSASGTFTFQAPITHPTTPAPGWADQWSTYVGDFNGDGRDDLLWNRIRSGQGNLIQVALSAGGGAFNFLPPDTIPGNFANEWKTYIGDATGDGKDDIIFNYMTAAGGNRTVTAVSQGGTFTLGQLLDHDIKSWSGYTAFVADIDGGGRTDILWSSLPRSENRVHTAITDANGSFTQKGSTDYLSGWGGYGAYVGDIDGDGRADMIWTKPGVDSAGTIAVHRATGGAGGKFTLVSSSAQVIARPQEWNSGSLRTLVGDFNGDGRSDIVFNQLSAGGNRVKVGLGGLTGSFTFNSIPQDHPVFGVNWAQVDGSALVMDVNGDSRDDLVWVNPSTPSEIYVALAKAP
jgi:hypothetical protein